jgi:hypothetical protein
VSPGRAAASAATRPAAVDTGTARPGSRRTSTGSLPVLVGAAPVVNAAAAVRAQPAGPEAAAVPLPAGLVSGVLDRDGCRGRTGTGGGGAAAGGAGARSGSAGRGTRPAGVPRFSRTGTPAVPTAGTSRNSTSIGPPSDRNSRAVRCLRVGPSAPTRCPVRARRRRPDRCTRTWT